MGNTSISTKHLILSHPIPIPQQLTRHLPSSPLKSSMLTLSQSTILLSDDPTVRSANAKPPLQRLTKRKPENLDCLDVSYGLTSYFASFLMSQFCMSRFWKRAIPFPLHIRHATSELTGEYTCVILLWLNSAMDGELDWMAEFVKR